MIRVNVICEGKTEYTFVNKLLFPHFMPLGILVIPIDIGGANRYQKIKKDIVGLLNYEQDAYVTTMIDFYGMNQRFPQYEYESGLNKPSIEKVEAIELAIKNDILSEATVHNTKFMPYVQLHEFEALLFSEPETLQDWLSIERKIPANSFSNIRNAFDTPEDINDSPQTAPSKRIIAIASSYEKPAEGVSVASEIGLDKMRSECPHFNNWINQLEKLAE
jgi:Domain of unknown function (DUF4276)